MTLTNHVADVIEVMVDPAFFDDEDYTPDSTVKIEISPKKALQKKEHKEGKKASKMHGKKMGKKDGKKYMDGKKYYEDRVGKKVGKKMGKHDQKWPIIDII